MSGINYHAWTHRPKSSGGTDPLDLPESQWIKAASSTDTGTSFTTLDWTETTGDSCYTAPTFAINASANLEIGRDGMYDLMIYETSAGTSSTNQAETHILRGYRNSGATPIVLGAGSFTTPREVRRLYRYDDTTVVDSGNLLRMPEWYTPLAYFDGDIGIDGVTEIEFQAYVEINSTATSTTDITWSLFCRRIGPPGFPTDA